MSAPLYDVTVSLLGEDGNAFAIIGAVTRALKGAGVDKAGVEAFTTEAMAGDYDHLLQVCMKTVNVE